MKTLSLRIILFLIFCGVHTLSAQSYVLKKDLRSEWQAFDGAKFLPFNESDGTSVFYLGIKNPDPRGEYLRITAKEPVSIFVNNQLAGSFRSRILSIDSIAKMAGKDHLLIAIYYDKLAAGDVSTELLSAARSPLRPEHDKRRQSFFKDFVIVGTLILLVMVAAMIRLNPKLAADYFSIPRIFSLRDTEDLQISSRIGNSSNILFYVYCSLLLGFYLLVIFHFVPSVYPVSHSFQSESFFEALTDWLRLSSVLLGFLVLKIFLVISFSSLFGMPQVAGIHFFNWVRIIVVFLGLLTLFLIIYFIWYGQDISLLSLLLRLLAWIIAGWIVLIYLKLVRKSSASMFHLFSYICATELIPFLFVIRVLYK